MYSFEGTHFLEQAQFLKEKVNESILSLTQMVGRGVR